MSYVVTSQYVEPAGALVGYQCLECGAATLVYFKPSSPWTLPLCPCAKAHDPELEALADEFLGPKEGG